jgi:peptidoglycan/LPS O-acetylase OafA/YrhL
MNRFVRFLGVTSYGLYLYHNFAGTLVNALLGLVGREALSHNLPLNLLMMTTVTLILTVLSWALIEKPINSLKRFVPYFPGTPREQQQPSATAGAAVSS